MAWGRRAQPTTITDYPSRPSRAARREAKKAARDDEAATRRRADHHRHARDVDRAGWAAHDKRDRRLFGD